MRSAIDETRAECALKIGDRLRDGRLSYRQVRCGLGHAAKLRDREQNLRKLVDLPWIGIPLVYRNGAAGVLTFEKGDEGNKVFNKALNLWANAS